MSDGSVPSLDGVPVGARRRQPSPAEPGLAVGPSPGARAPLPQTAPSHDPDAGPIKIRPDQDTRRRLDEAVLARRYRRGVARLARTDLIHAILRGVTESGFDLVEPADADALSTAIRERLAAR